MKIDMRAARAAAAERTTGAVLLPKGWYKVKLIEVEDKEGNDEARNLKITARVYLAGAIPTSKKDVLPEGTKHTKQYWNVNYVKRDGDSNPYGMATAAALIEATGAAVEDDNEVEVDQFEGSKVWAYLGVQAEREGVVTDKATGQRVTRTFAAQNEVKDFKAADVADPTKRDNGGAQATAALEEQAKAAKKAEAADKGKVHEEPFDDDIPF